MTGILNGTTYYYRVSAVNAFGEGLQSNEGSAIPAGAPGAPTLNSATASRRQRRARLVASGVERRRRGSPATGSTAARRAAARRCSRRVGAVTGFTDSGLVNGTKYYYKVSRAEQRRRRPALGRALSDAHASATVPGAPTLDSGDRRRSNVASELERTRPPTAARRSPTTGSTAAPPAAARPSSPRSEHHELQRHRRRQRHRPTTTSSPRSTPSARACSPTSAPARRWQCPARRP